MPPYHRRILFSDDPNHGDCNGWGRYRCYSPPSPPTTSPSPSPADVPSPWASPSPGSAAPAPSPFRHPAAGRRDQGGTSGYGDAAGAGHHRQFVNYTIIAAAAVVFLSLILIGVSVAVRRRQLRRRRRQALLAPAPAVATNVGNDDPEAGGGGGGVVHHVWYIRTVGLDEAAIDSIAVTRYRAGAGLLGAADCSVCLGEFQDGELVRLLPKCAHAFHVPCIDTWLRAHVNCPLCRSDVLDPAAAAATGVAIQSNSDQSTADPDVNANAAAEQVDAASDSTLEHEDEELENAPHLQEDQQEQQFSTPEPVPQLPCPLPWNVRRAASMDAAIASTAAGVAALDRLSEADPQGEQNGREKHRSGATGHLSNPSTERPTPSGAPRSFFSRHYRARSSVLPL